MTTLAPRPILRSALAAARMPLVGGSSAVMTATVVTSLLGFGYWWLLTQHMSAHAVGAAVSAMALASTAALLATAGLQPALAVTVPALAPSGQRAVTRLAIRQAATRASIAGVLAVTGVRLASASLPELSSPLVAALIVATAAAVAVAGVVDAACMGRRRARGMSGRNGAFAAGKLAVVTVTVVIAGDWGPTAACALVLASWGGCALISAAVTVRWLFKDVPHVLSDAASTGVTTDAAPRLAAVGWHHATEVAGQLPGLALPLLVAVRLGPVQAAYFNITWMVGGVCFLLAPAVASALVADGGHEPDRLSHRARTALLVVGGLLVPPVAVFTVAGSRILDVFGAGYGASGTGLLVLLALSAVPDALTNVAVAVWRVRGRLARAAALNAGMSTAALCFTALTLPWLGIAAAGWAWLLAQAAGCVVVGVDLARRRNRRPAQAAGHTVAPILLSSRVSTGSPR